VIGFPVIIVIKGLERLKLQLLEQGTGLTGVEYLK